MSEEEKLQHDLEERRVQRFLKRYRARRAAVQLPSGLKPLWSEISESFQKVGTEPILMEGCFGACDLADERAKLLGCDVLVHYGHSEMGLPTVLPTLYVEARLKSDPIPAFRSALPKLPFRRLGLLTTVQHAWAMRKVVDFLRSSGLRPVVGRKGPRCKYPGQLLGCDFTCAKSVASRVDGFIYFGTGEFHPFGAALATGKDVVNLNILSGQVSEIGGIGDFLRARKALISRAALGQKFGIIVSIKRGQCRARLAEELKKELVAGGKNAEIVLVDRVDPPTLRDFDFDALVCAACPRIPLHDVYRFEEPFLTPFEVKVMLGKADFEPYMLDEIRKEDFGKV